MKRLFFLIFFSFFTITNAQQLPEGFVYLQDIVPTISIELRYYSSNNFIGKPIDGYNNNCLIVTRKTAAALKEIQQKLIKKGLGLKIFDAYRPQKAVNHFVRWAKVLNDTLKKQEFYPNVAKNKLFKLGFIASKSGHSRGSTVDLTLINTNTKKELDMGSAYDFFGKQSHPFFKGISAEHKKNRLLLRRIMVAHNFVPYNNEWWHFTLKNEPFPKTYFDFNVQ